MKENKFRGKNTFNYKWVYGYYFYDKFDDKHYILQAQEDEEEPFMYEVIPETVGQYTGLKDDNNEEIYEDDIINTWNKNYRVIYDGYMWALKDFYISCLDIPYDAFSEFSGKKVGNIHDNPKLLEV
ncbi:YopX family protein [Clostridium sp. CTA-6]